MKVIAKRSFSGGLDKKASKLDGPPNERRYVRHHYMRDTEYEVNDDEARQFIKQGWMEESNIKTKAAAVERKEKTAQKEEAKKSKSEKKKEE